MIVVAHLLRDEMPSVVKIAEYVLVQALVPEPCVERLAKRILRRLARCDVMPLNAHVLRPGDNGDAGEFRTIV